MSSKLYFNFHPTDFMHGVRGLSAQEVGVYTMMLCRIYEESGPVEYHPMRLSAYCGMREKTFVKVIEKLVDLGKLIIAEGMISNRRAEVEISHRAHKLKNNSKAGKVSGQKRQQNQRSQSTDVEQTINKHPTIREEERDKEKDTASAVSKKKDDPPPEEPSPDRIAKMQNRLHAVLGLAGHELNIQGGFVVGGMDRNNLEMRMQVWDQHGLADVQLALAVKAALGRERDRQGDPNWLPRTVKYFDGPIADFARDLKAGKVAGKPEPERFAPSDPKAKAEADALRAEYAALAERHDPKAEARRSEILQRFKEIQEKAA